MSEQKMVVPAEEVVADVPESSETVNGNCDDDEAKPSASDKPEEQLPSTSNGSAGSSVGQEALEKFLQECTKCMEVSEDSNKILKKIQKYFSQVDEEIKKGRQLIKYLAASSLKISEGSVYIVIKEVIDYFKDRRAGSKKVNEAHRVKLEKYLEKVDKEIKKLQAKEVDFDDEDESDYILECKLKKRFARAYKMLCDITGCLDYDPVPKIEYSGSRYQEINVLVTDYLQNNAFPDYKSMLTCIVEANKVNNLRLSEETLSQLAREIFSEVGNILKSRRLEEFGELVGCYLTDDLQEDPALENPDLDRILKENETKSRKNLDAVFNEYAEQQEKLKVEPEEVGDEEGSNGEGNSEEEELESSEDELSFTEEDIEITDNMTEIKMELDSSPAESAATDDSSNAALIDTNGHSNGESLQPSPAPSPKPIEIRRKRPATEPPQPPCPPKKVAPIPTDEEEDDCIILD